jgi:hypothetical protein
VRESRWGSPWLALAALLAGAGAIRLVGIEYGLPFSLLNPDEADVVPRAWRMTHGGGLDPGWFDYPTLLIYVLAPFQNWADEPSYLAARLVLVALALAGVAAAWWLGGRAYGLVAGFVAAAATAVATVHVEYSRMAVTDVPLTLGVAVTLALLVRGQLLPAGIAIGLTASFKYPGVRPARSARRRRLGTVAAARRRCRACPAGVPSRKPLLRGPSRGRAGRRTPRPARRPTWLAGLRERPLGADRLSRPALGGNRPSAPGRTWRPRPGAPVPDARRPRARGLRARLLPDRDAA